MTKLRPALMAVIAGIVAGACGTLGEAGGFGPVIDIEGVGPAEIVVSQPGPPAADHDWMSWRWTGARAIREAEGGQVVIVWLGGPTTCWNVAGVHLDARGVALGASVGERQTNQRGACKGERGLLAVFVPTSAIPAPGNVADWPPPGPGAPRDPLR